MDELIRSLDVPIIRNSEMESKWSYEENSGQILEAVSYHCPNSRVSKYMMHQLSQMLFQGYLVVEDLTFASPIRSIYETMEKVSKSGESRGILKNISRQVGFTVKHTHFAQSSCIIENWVNNAKREKHSKEPRSSENIYNSLISSLSKKNKTGEWIVYSESDNQITFWCVWLHKAGDDNLVNIINSQGT